MPNALVTGANRGIGLGFVRQYADEGWTVYAACRNPRDATSLAGLGSGVIPVEVDVSKKPSIRALAESLRGVPLDHVVSNAGIDDPADRIDPIDIEPEQWMRVLAVNTFGPMYLAAHLRPNLEAGEHKKLAAVSSRYASMTYNNRSEPLFGDAHVYRASKAGLNAIWRSFAASWQPLGIACVVMRPGIVNTDMAHGNLGPGFKGMEPAESVRGMRKVIDALTLADSGKFIGYDGAEVPW